MNKRVLISTLLVTSGMLVSCGGEKRAVTEKPLVVTGVATEEVASREVDRYFEAVGTVRARVTTVISSKVVGVITSMKVRDGDRVRAGQVLIEIENRDARAQVDKAQAGLREAQSSTEELDRNLKAAEAGRSAAEAGRGLAETTLKRYQVLRERRSVSEQEFDEVAARARVAAAEVERAGKMVQVVEARRKMVEARIDQAKADLAAAQAYAGYSRIAAPIDGVITGKQADIGTLAAPGVPLLTIEDGEGGRNHRLEASVEESRSGEIAPGSQAIVRIDALGGGEITGRVVEIVPTADAATRTVTVKIELPASPKLHSGLFGRARFASGKRGAILVPGTALVERGQMQGVYVVDQKGVVRLQLVTVGERNGERIEILSGLNGGLKIVVDGRRIEREGVQIQ